MKFINSRSSQLIKDTAIKLAKTVAKAVGMAALDQSIRDIVSDKLEKCFGDEDSKDKD